MNPHISKENQDLQSIEEETEKKVVVLLSDMVRYSQKTAEMRPNEIKDFILEYHRNLQKIIQTDDVGIQEIEPSAGDGAVAVFEKRGRESKSDMYSRAVKAAVKMTYAMESGVIPLTRIGIFAGDIIEVQLGTQVMKFGASFTVASRLEELCEFFGTCFLMDREVAFWQTQDSKYLVSIGKVTPKNFDHPIHVYTMYKPGIHNCPRGVDEGELFEFIEMKNRAIELFCGNRLQGILPDFMAARERLTEAQKLFVKMTGKEDVASERVLEYIRNISYPTEDFKNVGMKIRETTGGTLGTSLLHLSNELLKAMDPDFYQTLVVDTDWERHFKLEWSRKGDVIIRIDDPPEGVYYIDNGSVNVVSNKGKLIATLAAGNVFGEMAYFSKKNRRNATVIANSDVILRKISGDEFAKLPIIKKIFKKIAHKRKKQKS